MLQFSVRSLMVATAAVAAAVAALVAEPSWASLAAMLELSTLFAALAVVFGVRSNGRAKVFWIGAAVPAGLAAIYACWQLGGVVYGWIDFQMLHEKPNHIHVGSARIGLTVLWCLAPINGLLCVVIHWLIWPKKPAPENQISK